MHENEEESDEEGQRSVCVYEPFSRVVCKKSTM